MNLFLHFDVPNTLNCDEKTLYNWLTVIEMNYHVENAYHNSTHAADVMQVGSLDLGVVVFFFCGGEFQLLACFFLVGNGRLFGEGPLEGHHGALGRGYHPFGRLRSRRGPSWEVERLPQQLRQSLGHLV